MPKLTDTQLVILSAAAQREGGVVLPPPKTLKLNPGTLGGVLRSLIKKALIAERPAAAGEATWRDAKDGRHLTLVLTDTGLQAIGVEPEASAQPVEHPAKPEKGRKRRKGHPVSRGGEPDAPIGQPRAGTKTALLIDLLGRKSGASIEEISRATGWQAHSVRGAISGALKKKLGLAIVSAQEEKRGRVYRLDGRR